MSLTWYQRLMWERMPKERYGWLGLWDKAAKFVVSKICWVLSWPALGFVLLSDFLSDDEWKF